MTGRISRLALRHFRGATVPVELTFDTENPILMIFGENGTGKSTIIDAIDMVCNRKVGSLVERSSALIKPHLASLGRELREVSVELSVDNTTWKAIHNSKGISVEGPNECPTVSILRRSQMLRLIEAQPAKRYEELKRFIDVAGVELSEDNLRSALKAAENRLKSALNARASADDGIEKLWIAEGKQGTDAISWVQEKLNADPNLVEHKIREYQTLVSAVTNAEESRINNLTANDDLAAKKRSLDKLEKVRESAEGQAEAGSLQLITILEESQKFLALTSISNSCPVCENSIVMTELQQRLTARLVEMDSLRRIQSSLKSAKSQYEQSTLALEQSSERWMTCAWSLADCLQKSELSGVKKLNLIWRDYHDLLQGNESSEACRQADALLEKFLPYRERLESIYRSLDANLSQLNAIRIFHEQVLKAEIDFKALSALKERLQRTLGIVHKTRLEFTDAILKEVSDECSSFYEKIHPDEPLGKLTLSMNEKTKGSLIQGAVFGARSDIPPQAYYSEAHLDTLGFCLFLALAKRSRPGNGVVILDDVFISVDSDHLDRIADLLVENVVEKAFAQIILTTHSREWREQFCQNRAVSNHCQLIELLPWSLDSGIRS